MSELDQLMDQMVQEFQRNPLALTVPQVGNEYLMTLTTCAAQHAVVAKNEDRSWRIYDPHSNTVFASQVEEWVDAMDQARHWVRRRAYLASIAEFAAGFEPPEAP